MQSLAKPWPSPASRVPALAQAESSLLRPSALALREHPHLLEAPPLLILE